MSQSLFIRQACKALTYICSLIPIYSAAALAVEVEVLPFRFLRVQRDVEVEAVAECTAGDEFLEVRHSKPAAEVCAVVLPLDEHWFHVKDSGEEGVLAAG